MVQCVHDIRVHWDNDLFTRRFFFVSSIKGKACLNPLAAGWAGTLGVG